MDFELPKYTPGGYDPDVHGSLNLEALLQVGAMKPIYTGLVNVDLKDRTEEMMGYAGGVIHGWGQCKTHGHPKAPLDVYLNDHNRRQFESGRMVLVPLKCPESTEVTWTAWMLFREAPS